MSYVVEIIRPITKADVVALASEDREFSILAEGDDWADLGWRRGDEGALFSFAQSRITLTTPSASAWEKATAVAEKLGAKVIGEEDELRPPSGTVRPGAVRSGWAGWPVLVAILLSLLVWRW